MLILVDMIIVGITLVEQLSERSDRRLFLPLQALATSEVIEAEPSITAEPQRIIPNFFGLLIFCP